MKKISFVCLVLLLASMAFAQPAVQKPESTAANAKPASNLYFVFLNRPSNAPTYSKEKGEEIQAGHVANMKRLHGEGKLVMAGPFMDDTSQRGIFVFKANSIDEVKGWIATDPAIIAGRLVGDVHPWEPAKGEIHLPAKDAPMENFVMLIYRWAADAKSKSKEAMGAAFQGHKKYQLELFESGKTEIGGPFSDAMTGEFIGVIIAHGNRQEGEKLAAGDPVVQAGVARAEVHEWITAKGVLQR